MSKLSADDLAKLGESLGCTVIRTHYTLPVYGLQFPGFDALYFPGDLLSLTVGELQGRALMLKVDMGLGHHEKHRLPKPPAPAKSFTWRELAA